MHNETFYQLVFVEGHHLSLLLLRLLLELEGRHEILVQTVVEIPS